MKDRIEHLDESSLSLNADKIQNSQDIIEVHGSPKISPEFANSPFIKKKQPTNLEEAKLRLPIHEEKQTKAPCLSTIF